MLSWKKLKENTTWLRDRLAAAWAATSGFAQRRPLLAVMAVLLAFAGITEGYRYRFEIQSFFDNGHDGKILVNSPTVYTRQRLVNDRLDQARWLRAQLDLTEVGKSKVFNSIDQIQHRSSDSQARIGSPSDNRTPDKDLQPIDTVEPTTTALFRAKNAYREEVRSEITQTELDDRHDIKGNTIFRLTFDSSVVAGSRKDSVAAIGVKLGHHPETTETAAKRVYDDDYQSLYEDWVRYFQVTIRKSLSTLPYSILTPTPYPRLRLLFSKFLFQRLCQFIDGDNDLSKDPTSCNSQKRIMAEKILSDFTDLRAKSLTDQRDKSFLESLDDYRKRNYKFPIDDVATANLQLYNKATTICPQTNKSQIAPWELGISSGSNDNMSGNNYAPTSDSIGCPYYDSLNERMIAGILLYDAMFSLAKSDGRKNAQDLPTFYKNAIDTFFGSCLKGSCEIRLSSLKCYVADFIKSDLDGFDNKNLSLRQKIKHFLSLEIVGREVNDCDILVRGLPNKYSDPEDVEDAGARADDSTKAEGDSKKDNPDKGGTYVISEEFTDNLNIGTDAFAYSVTPKNLTENISTAAESRDAYELLLRAAGQGKQIVNLLRQRTEQDQSVVAHPVIVGFGSSRNSVAATILGKRSDRDLAGIRDVDFGWIIGPRSRAARDFEQIDGQYPLTAFISVPSWWRTVELHVETCWLSRLDLGALKPKDLNSNICVDHTNAEPSTIFVRLPSAIPEISRKLGFDVLQEPSLYDSNPKELVVGQPGSLLLEGARLWRSTEVTAGGQRAERINVLPNMDGIIAQFKCVHPPTGPRQIRRNSNTREEQLITMDSVRVWTSEGVTEPIGVVFIWPGNEWEKSLNVCPGEEELAEGVSKAITTERKQALETTTKTDEPSTPATAPGNVPPNAASTNQSAKVPATPFSAKPGASSALPPAK